MTTGKGFDRDRARSDPGTVSGEPGKVLSHPDLDPKQKREILESWWQDARRLSLSEGENMGGGEDPMSRRVNDAFELEWQTGVGAAHKRTLT